MTEVQKTINIVKSMDGLHAYGDADYGIVKYDNVRFAEITGVGGFKSVGSEPGRVSVVAYWDGNNYTQRGFQTAEGAAKGISETLHLFTSTWDYGYPPTTSNFQWRKEIYGHIASIRTRGEGSRYRAYIGCVEIGEFDAFEHAALACVDAAASGERW